MSASKWHFWVFGILAYAIALIATFPADRAYGWLIPLLDPKTPVQLFGVNGTVWSGGSDRAHIYDQDINGLRWRVKPLPLILGRLEVDLNAPFSGGTVAGTLSRAMTGQGLSIESPHIDLPLATLLDAKHSPIPITGRLTGDLTRIDIAENGGFEVDTGDLLIDSLTVALPTPLLLGGFKVRIEHDAKGALVVKATDTGGPLELNATITLPNADRYVLIAELGSRDKRNAVLMQSLRMLGAPDRTGTVRIQRQGSIKQDLALFGL